MAERIILASGSPFRKAMLEDAGVDIDVVPAEIDERAVEAPLEGSGASPEDVALVLAEAKALDVSERQPGRAGARLRPDAVARRRIVSQAGRYGGGAAASAGAVGQDASAEQRRGAGARRRGAVAACRRREPDHAQARAGFHRPASGAGRRQGVERASAPTRSRARASSCSRRSRATISPSSACRCWPCLQALRELGAIDG